MTEEYCTTLWENLKARANYLATTDIDTPVGSELTLCIALTEELEKVYTRIDKLELEVRKLDSPTTMYKSK